MYRICSMRTWGEYKYDSILHLIIQLIYFTFCSFMYRICSKRTWGEYKYDSILHLIIQLIYFTVCSFMYRICSKKTWGEYNYDSILKLLIVLIYFSVCSCIYRICSDRTWRKYEYMTILQLLIELIHFSVCRSIRVYNKFLELIAVKFYITNCWIPPSLPSNFSHREAMHRCQRLVHPSKEFSTESTRKFCQQLMDRLSRQCTCSLGTDSEGVYSC
jgi:hypothetical protein